MTGILIGAVANKNEVMKLWTLYFILAVPIDTMNGLQDVQGRTEVDVEVRPFHHIDDHHLEQL